MGEVASKAEAQLEEVRKKAAEEIKILQTQNEIVARTHTEAAEAYQLERERLSGEVTSLQ